MARELQMPPEIDYIDTPVFSEGLSAAEKARLDALEAKFNKPKTLSATEQARLAELDKKFAKAPVGDVIPTANAEAGLIGKFTDIPTFGFGDEIMAGIGAGIAYPFVDEGLGSLYSRGLEAQRGNLNAAGEQYPVTSTALQVVGVVPTLGLGGGTQLGKFIGSKAAQGIAPAATSALGKFGNLASRSAIGAGTAGAGGAAYGFGSGEGSEGRMAGAKDVGMVGAAIGAGLPVAGAVVSPALGKLSDYITKKAAIKSGEIVKADLSPAMKKVYNRLAEDLGGEEQVKQALNSYQSTQGKTLLETGGARTLNLGEGAALFPSGQAKAVEFFDKAIGAAPDKLKTALSAVSKSQNYYDDLGELVKVGREKAKPLYDAAYKKNQSINSPVIDKILKTPEGKSALGEAVKNVQNELALVAKPTPELTALARELQDLGAMGSTQGGVASGLKLKTLDEVKKAMDGTINKAFRAGDDAEAGRIINLKNTLLKEIDSADKSGAYAKARAASGDYLSSKKSMEEGLQFFADNKELAIKKFNALTKPEQTAYKAGVARKIRDTIEKTTDGGNVARIFKNETNRQKLQAILPQKEYDILLKKAEEVDNLYKSRNKIIGGSPTASRQVAREEFETQGTDFATDLAVGRGLIDSTMNAAGKWVGKKASGLSDKTAKEVAEILFEQDPKKKFQIMQDLTRQATQSPNSLAKTEAARKLNAIVKVTKETTPIRTEPRITAVSRNPQYK